ncbi:MAG: TonB family protein [bacterium]|nr:TonB family protein [bacterium]
METGSKNEQHVLGARDLKGRLGVFLMQGLVASMFLHSAVMTLVGYWPKSDTADKREVYDTVIVCHPPIIPVPPRPGDFTPTPPVKPDIAAFVPVDEPPAQDTVIERTDPDDYPTLHSPSGDATDSGDGRPGAGDPLLIDTSNRAGYDNPWEKFIPFEIPPAALSTNPAPAYPNIAQKAGTEGRVLVWVNVGDRGDVLGWHVVDVSPAGLGFEDEVARVIPLWKFTPAIQQNAPVAVWVVIPFQFKLKN